MLKNYIKTAIRNMSRNKAISLINISGLAMGMACTILIMMWVMYEFSYDSFYKNADQTDMVVRKYENPDGSINFSPVTVMPLAKALKSEFPEIIKAARFNDAFGEFPLKYNDKLLFANGAPADQEFVDIFSFPFRYGNSTTALNEENSLVISKTISEKFFKDSNPVGKTMQFELWGGWWDFKVTGVLEDLPQNSQFNFEILIPVSFLISHGWTESDWLNGYVKTFIQTAPGTDYKALNAKIADINQRHHSNAQAIVTMQPLKKMHLHNLEGGGRIVYVYIFITVAAFILMISCINFINLTTAGSEKRAKEIGIRKVIGAFRKEIGKQFLTESVLIVTIAMLFAILLVMLCIPFFNRLLSVNLSLQSGSILLWIAGTGLITGLISGIYPSVVLSSSNVINIIKKNKKGVKANSFPSLKNTLVGFQFILSIILIIGVIIVFKQLTFIKNKPLGYDKEQILRVTLRSELRNQDTFETIKQELLNNPRIFSITACNSNFTNWQYQANENDISWQGKSPQDRINMEVNSVDADYMKTFGMQMLQGRFFSKEFPTDKNQAVVLNETAVRLLNLENPVGSSFEYHGKRQIVGVIRDFNFYSLHQKIEPMILYMEPLRYHSIYFKVQNADMLHTIQFIENTIKKEIPDYPFEYSFLDDNLARLYKTEYNIGTLLTIFSALAISISCLGLLGIIAIVVEQRTKEIGIRKVLGATVSGLLMQLNKGFIKLIIVANIIAWPLAYYAMGKWLAQYAYRIQIDWWIFLLAGSISLLIAMLTISWLTIRAAHTNPIKALRYE